METTNNKKEHPNPSAIIEELKDSLMELKDVLKSLETEMSKYEGETSAKDKLGHIMKMNGNIESIEFHSARIESEFADFLESAIY